MFALGITSCLINFGFDFPPPSAMIFMARAVLLMLCMWWKEMDLWALSLGPNAGLLALKEHFSGKDWEMIDLVDLGGAFSLMLGRAEE